MMEVLPMKSKEQKRQEAMERQEAYDRLSLLQKLELAQLRRGNSKKEITKLCQKIGWDSSTDHIISPALDHANR
jgi:hypothetical protein